MEELEITTIPQLSTNECVKMLGNMYSKAIESNNLDKLPSVMLWGPPGIGKSQSIREIANKINYLTGKTVVTTDVRLLLFNPVDLRGIPTANSDKTLAVWLKPKIFQMDEDENIVNILFLDEISAAPPSVQAAAYQITLDKTVGEHKLPNNCIVIAAGNRTTDKSVAYAMPKALANRLMHIEISVSFDSWNEWAIENNIDSRIIGFLKFKPNYLMKFTTSNAHLAFPTPRSWEMTSNILRYISSKIDDVYPMIEGLIGKGAAIEFKAYSKIYDELPLIEDIFEGKTNYTTNRSDVFYAIVTSMIEYVRMNPKLSDDKIENSIKFIEGFPPEYSTVLLRDYLNISESFKKRLMGIPLFMNWMRTKGKLLDEFNNR